MWDNQRRGSAMLEARETTGTILAGTTALLRGNAKLALTATAALAAAATLFDVVKGGAASGGNVALGAGSVVAQCLVTSTLLGERGLMAAGARPMRFWATVGLGLVANLAILIGMVLLIVPGLILAVRWFVAVPALIGEDLGVFAALGASWEETKGRFWPILGAILVIFVPLVIAVGLGAAFVAAIGGSVVFAAFINVAVYGAIVVGWHAAVAIHAPGHARLSDLAETFA